MAAENHRKVKGFAKFAQLFSANNAIISVSQAPQPEQAPVILEIRSRLLTPLAMSSKIWLLVVPLHLQMTFGFSCGLGSVIFKSYSFLHFEYEFITCSTKKIIQVFFIEQWLKSKDRSPILHHQIGISARCHLSPNQYLKLLAKNNPASIELLFAPQETIVFQHPLMAKFIA